MIQIINIKKKLNQAQIVQILAQVQPKLSSN